MVRAIMEQSFGPALLPIPILDSAEISHAALRMMTVYELEKPIGTPRTHKRCRANLDEAMGQIEALVRQGWGRVAPAREEDIRSEEHTSELQSLMRISYAVFCLKNKNDKSKQQK